MQDARTPGAACRIWFAPVDAVCAEARAGASKFEEIPGAPAVQKPERVWSHTVTQKQLEPQHCHQGHEAHDAHLSLLPFVAALMLTVPSAV